jgi:L-ascorbate metabolism protein UlaG (beta-lactamase superfamily)
MQITHLGHATLLVQTAQVRVLVDPGTFSDAWHGITDLDAVLVTHQHPDHVDVGRVPDLCRDNPEARWYVEPAVVPLIPSTQAYSFAAGEGIRVGDLDIAGVGGRHAVIHPDLPDIGNTGLLLSEVGGATVFHPGDSYAALPDGVDIAAVPLNGPWAKMSECIDFVRALAPAQWFPIHDALLSARGRGLYLDRTAAIAGVPATDLADGTPLRV